MRFEGYYDTLRVIKEELVTSTVGDFMNFSMLLAGLGAVFYIAYRVWGSMARAEPLDIFPLLRPIAIGVCILGFDTLVLPAIDGVIDVLTDATMLLEDQNAEEISQLTSERDELKYALYQKEIDAGGGSLVHIARLLGILPSVEVNTDNVAMTADVSLFWSRIGDKVIDFFVKILSWVLSAVSLGIATVAVFMMVILGILGPISFAFGCFDNFQASIPAWISRYVSISLWIPVAFILGYILDSVHIYLLELDIVALNGGADVPGATGSSFFLVLFYIIGILAYTKVPTVAGYIVEAGGGSGGFGSRVAGATGSLFSGAATVVAGGVGAAVGGAAGAKVGASMVSSRGGRLIDAAISSKNSYRSRRQVEDKNKE